MKLGHDLVAGATLNVNGFSGPIVRASGKAMASGDYLSGDVVHFTRNNGQWTLGGGGFGTSSGSGTGDPAVIPVTVLTGTIVKTVGGTNPDFADLNAAFTYASSVRIPFGSSLTFQIRAGKFTYASSVKFSHPDGARIFVLGATLTNAVPAPSAMPFTGSSASQRAADTASAFTTLRASYATELYFTGGTQFFIAGDLGNLQDLLLSSDGTGSNVSLISIVGGAQNFTRISIVGAQSTGLVALNFYTYLNGICHLFGCGLLGLSASNNGNVILRVGSQLGASSNSYAGLQVSGGAVFGSDNGGPGGPITYARGNGSYGVDCNGAIAVFTNGSQFLSNGYASIFCSNPGYVNASSCTLSGGTFGVYALFICYVNVDTANVAAGNTAFRADNMALIYRVNSTASTPTPASPAVGSVGNNNAYII